MLPLFGLSALLADVGLVKLAKPIFDAPSGR